MATEVRIPSFSDNLEPLLRGIESIQRDVLHNRYRSELSRLLAGKKSEEEAGIKIPSTAQTNWTPNLDQKQLGLLKGLPMEDQQSLYENFMNERANENVAKSQSSYRPMELEEQNALANKYREQADVVASKYPRDMRINPFQQQGSDLSFDQRMALKKANSRGTEPVVYYNPTTKERGNAYWAMSQVNKGQEVYPLAKTDITSIPGKQAGVAISETKLLQNYFDNPSAATATPLSEYLGKQGKEGITPLDRTRWEKVADYWNGTEPPALIIRDKKSGKVLGFDKNNQEIPMTNPPKQAQPVKQNNTTNEKTIGGVTYIKKDGKWFKK